MKSKRDGVALLQIFANNHKLWIVSSGHTLVQKNPIHYKMREREKEKETERGRQREREMTTPYLKREGEGKKRLRRAIRRERKNGRYDDRR